MIRMGVGRRFWNASMSKITDDMRYKAPVQRFIDTLRERLLNGDGLLFFGPHGTGKTALASIVMKEARARKATCYMLDAGDITDVFFGQVCPTNSEYTVLEWAKRVDLLVLDDVAGEYWTPFAGNSTDRLVRYRAHRKLSTIVTTNLAIQAFKEKVGPGLMQRVAACCLPLEVSGISWRSQERDDLAEALGVEA